MATTASVLDVLVIGAGQAGLALGYQLRESGQRFLLVERNERLGESWRRRFDSLTLFTPRAHSALPGLPLPGDPDGYPAKDEIADYLEDYARHYELPVKLGTGIDRLERQGDLFQATTDAGEVLTARSVVIATGAFQQPAVPAIAAQLDPEVTQLTAESYRNPALTATGTVLVVGDGATGRQIARELSETHRVIVAAGRPRKVSPHRLLGRSIFWWMDKLGILTASPTSRIGRRLKATDPFPGKGLTLKKLRAAGITITGRLTGVAGRQVTFADGQAAEVDVAVWATGYRDETDWVAIPEVKDARGFVQEGGVSPLPGLFFIGRSWQRNRGSALLTGVGADAELIARELTSAAAESPEQDKRPAQVQLAPAS
jgi:putative flavoprotein involved in K+ transport